MAARVRRNGTVVCAAKYPEMEGDVYLDDVIQSLLIGLGVTVSEDGGGVWTVADPREWTSKRPQIVDIWLDENARLEADLAEARKLATENYDAISAMTEKAVEEKTRREKSEEKTVGLTKADKILHTSFINAANARDTLRTKVQAVIDSMNNHGIGPSLKFQGWRDSLTRAMADARNPK